MNKMTDDHPPHICTPATSDDTSVSSNNSTHSRESDINMRRAKRSASTDFIQTASGEREPAPKIDWRDLPVVIQRHIVCNPDGQLQKIIPAVVCDACPYCNDTCQLEDCPSCAVKREKLQRSPPARNYSICQTRRNRNLACCWLVVDSSIYNATIYLGKHPGGVTSILRHAGGPNCSQHLYFHSTRGKLKWKSCLIGKLVYCEGGKHDPNSPPESKPICAIS